MSSTYPLPLVQRTTRSAQSATSTTRPQSNKSYVSSAARRHPPPSSYSDAGTTSTSNTFFKKRQSIYATVDSSTESLCTGYTASCFSSSGGPTHSTLKSKKMRSSMPPMDSTEFDTLPPAIRRKYFSSLERLRYAQQQFSTSSPTSVKPSHLRSFSAVSKSKAGRQSSDTFRSQTSGRHSKFRKHNNSTADAFVLSQTDAQWFLELPEAVQRKHFSPEERKLLATKCKSIIVDATDETLYRMGQRNRSCSLDSRRSSVSTIASLQRRSFDSDIQNATEEVRKSFRWMDEDGDLDLQLRQFQENSENAAPARTHKRRTLSLTKNIRTHSSSSNSSETRNRMTGINRRTASQSGFLRIPSAPKTSIESDAAYYQDPDARLKLRVYLASPQKFDEAIEFGFPSQTKANDLFQQSRPVDPTIGKVTVAETVEPVTDYLGELSPLDDPVESKTSLVSDAEEPEPPESTKMRSIDSGRHSGPRPLLDHYPHASPGNREMTLRMTLTRKDLRATETVAVKNSTALTMEELPPECSTIDWDAIDREAASGLKRLWRRVKGY